MAEKMQSRRGKKRLLAIRDDEKSKECRPTEPTPSAVAEHATQREAHLPKHPLRLQRFACQTKKTKQRSMDVRDRQLFVSIIKEVKSSPENDVPVDISSAESLQVCECCNSEKVCFPEVNLHTGSSSEEHDTTQQNETDFKDERLQDNKHNCTDIRFLSSTQEPDLSPPKTPKRLLCTCLAEDETPNVRNGKRQRKSDFSLPDDCKERDISSGGEERGNSKSNCGVNENKPQVLLSFKPEHMKEKRFLYDAPQNSNTKMPDQPFEVCTSWEGCAVEKIKNISDKSNQVLDLINNNSAPITICNFFHYVKIIAFFIGFWKKQEKHDRQDVIFLVGRFSVRLQANDLYCCPIKKDEEELHLQDKDLSYGKLKPSKEFAKNCSETIWNYMVGNHRKVNSSVKAPQDAIAVCAILFSEVIRYPNMFFHNILMMLYNKSWEDIYNYHPMLRGGSWKHQSNNVPEEVKKIEKENLLHFAKIMSEEGIKSILFRVSIPTLVDVTYPLLAPEPLTPSTGSQSAAII